MTTKSERGFTIIEVMLFLAITGGLFAALMLGVNNGITQQRYLDSVRSYKALLQDQYSQALNIRQDLINSSTDAWHCDDSDGGVVEGAGTSSTRGISQCVILGRAISLSGESVATSSVTGYEPTGTARDAIRQGNDIQALVGYEPRLVEYDRQDFELDWGSELTLPRNPSGGGSGSASGLILILRSPATGVIRVFTSPGAVADLKTMITDTNASSDATLRTCVMGNSGMLPKQVVSIDPRLASADAVTAVNASNGECRA